MLTLLTPFHHLHLISWDFTDFKITNNDNYIGNIIYKYVKRKVYFLHNYTLHNYTYIYTLHIYPTIYKIEWSHDRPRRLLRKIVAANLLHGLAIA